jgi:hypothetical protein
MIRRRAQAPGRHYWPASCREAFLLFDHNPSASFISVEQTNRDIDGNDFETFPLEFLYYCSSQISGCTGNYDIPIHNVFYVDFRLSVLSWG